MPYASKAQQGKFHAMLNRGEIKASTVKEFDDSTDYSKLPARVGRKGKKKRSGIREMHMARKKKDRDGDYD